MVVSYFDMSCKTKITLPKGRKCLSILLGSQSIRNQNEKEKVTFLSIRYSIFLSVLLERIVILRDEISPI